MGGKKMTPGAGLLRFESFVVLRYVEMLDVQGNRAKLGARGPGNVMAGLIGSRAEKGQRRIHPEVLHISTES